MVSSVLCTPAKTSVPHLDIVWAQQSDMRRTLCSSLHTHSAALICLHTWFASANTLPYNPALTTTLGLLFFHMLKHVYLPFCLLGCLRQAVSHLWCNISLPHRVKRQACKSHCEIIISESRAWRLFFEMIWKKTHTLFIKQIGQYQLQKYLIKTL